MSEEKKYIKYIGKLDNNKYDGRGFLYGENGKIEYNGYFRDGKKNGFGREYIYSELEYIGFFKNDLYSGYGTLYFNNKKRYEGKFKNGKYYWIGIEYLENGKKRTKMKFSIGEPSIKCYGILYGENNEEVYSGLLKNGIPEKAKNVSIYDKNELLIYKGDFLDFKYYGYGELYDKSNSYLLYKGNFKLGIYDGKGILYEYGKIKYGGEFKNGVYNGYGKLYGNYAII